MSDIGYNVNGGTVGRRTMEDNDRKAIAVQFNYYAQKGDSEKTESPVYILDPWTARFVGWHLLRRGIVDGIKDRIRRKPVTNYRIVKDS